MKYGHWLLVAVMASVLTIPAAAKVGVKASSSYDDSETDHSAAMAFDGLLETSWTEGQAGEGIDEWIEIDLGELTDITTISIWGGDYSDGSKRFSEQNRIKRADVILTTEDGEVTKTMELGDRYTRTELRTGSKPIRKVRVVIKEVYSGSIFDNTHISEIAFDYPAKPADAAPKLDKWMESREYEANQEAYEESRKESYKKCKNGDEYSENFKYLASAAVHGPHFMWSKVQEYAPLGFRGSYIELDPEAVERLQRLKDVNVIPYLETAAARAVGDDQYWLEDLVKAFRAHEVLISSKRHNIPNWGTTGLEPGALNGLGEPLSIDVNTSGRIYVADVGNNRLQWFTQDGRVEGAYGKEAGVAWSWFGVEGDPYATGASPGEGPMEFEQPTYVAIGNYDIVAVIDAKKRVQTFNEEGAQIGNFSIPSDAYVGYGRGCGTPIISWWGDDFYFMIDKEVWAFKPTGEQIVKFETSSEILGAVIVDGKLLVRHQNREIIEYAIEDGFRQGSFLRKEVPEDGSEDWDLATDAEDNLYIATDAGWLYIYNKKGKFVRKMQMFANAKDKMRIAVSPLMDYLYVTAGDEIHKVDLSQ